MVCRSSFGGAEIARDRARYAEGFRCRLAHACAPTLTYGTAEALTDLWPSIGIIGLGLTRAKTWNMIQWLRTNACERRASHVPGANTINADRLRCAKPPER